MDVGKIGQGGPINIDHATMSEGASNAGSIKIVEHVKITTEVQKNGQDTLSQEEVTKAVEKLNKFLQGENVHAEYQVHEKLKDVMIKIVNNDTKEVILEIPPKRILDMVAKMLETVGVLLDKKA